LSFDSFNDFIELFVSDDVLGFEVFELVNDVSHCFSLVGWVVIILYTMVVLVTFY